MLLWLFTARGRDLELLQSGDEALPGAGVKRRHQIGKLLA